ATMDGQGINRCMQDAYNLGWKLAFVEKGFARASLLDTYEMERRPIAEQAMSAASSLHQILLAGNSDPELVGALVGRCSGISHTYGDSSGRPSAEGPLPGDRAPDVDVGAGRTLFGLTRHPRYTLLGLPAGDKAGGKLEVDLKPLAHRFKQVMEFHVVPPSEG